MKKALLLLTLFISALTVISCSSDDNSSSEDQLVGKWKVIQVIENDIDAGVFCNDLTSFEYKRDGTLIEHLYEQEISGCELFETLEGTWVNNENGTYTFDYQRYSHTANVSFEDDNLIVSGNMSDSPGTFKRVYKRQ